MIDFDAQATSVLAPEALEAMLPWLAGGHWNPHSAHRGGRQAKAALEAARVRVAALLGGAPEGLIFTSGATEANNLALKGLVRPGRLLTFATEHSCVLAAARHSGRAVTVLPVRADGMPDMAAFRAALAAGDVAMLSAMRVNNEIGSIWPVAALAAEAKAAGALVHCDAAQGFGKLDCRLDGALAGVDLVSLSAHKMHGPKGIGALWVRPGVELRPLLDGGGQEAGVRSGTQSPALAAGFGAAAQLAAGAMAARRAAAESLMRIALDKLSALPHRVHGPAPLGPDRWPGNLSLLVEGVDSARLLAALPAVALSSGAACSSGAGRPSHVLAALGLPAAAVRATVRLGWGSYLTAREMADGMDLLLTAALRLAKPTA